MIAAEKKARGFPSGFEASRPVASVSVIGGRGAGKTTVLEAVRGRLDTNQRTVLDIIRPELFAPAQGLLTTVLALMLRQAEQLPQTDRQTAVHEDRAPRGESLTLENWLNRAMRYAAAIEDDSSGADAGLDEQISDAARSSGAWVDFVKLWRFVVAETVGTDGTLIVTIDDADLVSNSRLLGLLRGIRWLSTSPQVVILVALDLDEASTALRNEFERSSGRHPETNTEQFLRAPGRVEGAEVKQLVHGYLAKILPIEGRSVLSDMDEEARLRFRPLDSPETQLFDLLMKISTGLKDDDRLSDLLGYRGRGRRIRPTSLARALPAGPRELLSLFRRLDGELDHANSSAQVDPALWGWLFGFMLTRGILDSGLDSFSPSDFLSTRRQRDGGVKYTLNVSDMRRAPYIRESWAYLGGNDSTPSASPATGTPFRLRVAVPGPSEWWLEKMPAEQGARSGQRWLSESLSATLSLALEVARRLPLHFDVLNGSRISPRGGYNFPYFGEYEDTDDRFILAPGWTSPATSWVFERGWSQIVGVVETATAKTPEAMGDALLLDFLRLVLAVDRDPRNLRYRVHYLSRPNPVTTGEISDEFKKAVRRYSEAVRGSGEVDLVFRDWFETCLPQSLHPYVVTERFVAAVVPALRQAVADSGASARLVQSLAARVRRNSNAAWADPIIDLVRFFDVDTANELERHRAARKSTMPASTADSGGRSLREAIRFLRSLTPDGA